MRATTVDEPIRLQIVNQNEFERMYEPPQEDTGENSTKPSLRGDRWNIVLLLLLYTLQQFPCHLSWAFPLILQSRGVPSSDQGAFSLVSLPWALKILWAPVIDLVYWKKLGRRKSWIIPTQYLIGIITFIISRNVDEWIGDGTNAQPPNIKMLTITFFISNLLSSVQDVAVDGWSLTMLKKENVGHSATCNSLGSVMGTFLGYVLFIVLDSKEFCNKWLRRTPQETGILSFSSYLLAWSITYVVITTFILIFKKDNSLDIGENEEEIKMKVIESYSLLWKILKMEPVQILSVLLLSCRIGMGSVVAIAPLKLVDAKYTTVTLALLKAAFIPLNFLLPFISSRLLVGDKSLYSFINIIPQRIILGAVVTTLIYFIPAFKVGGEVIWWYSGLIFFVYSIYQLWFFIMSVAGQAYFSRISDPRYGGTYLTILNTMNNFGSIWTTALPLFLLDISTIRTCNRMNDSLQEEMSCSTLLDGFYVEVIISGVIGFIWVKWARRKVLQLNNYKETSWLIDFGTTEAINHFPLKI